MIGFESDEVALQNYARGLRNMSDEQLIQSENLCGTGCAVRSCYGESFSAAVG